MSDDRSEGLIPPPGAVHDLAERMVEFVRRAVGLVLDYTFETLPLLDHYLGGVPEDKEETVTLIAATAGAYFGEVARRVLGGEWLQAEGDPGGWELVLPGGVRFVPAALAREAILGEDTGDGDYDVPAEDRAAVEDALEARGAVPEDEYYSLCGRLETLQLIQDVVTAGRMSGN
jgi:hypothetical protein